MLFSKTSILSYSKKVLDVKHSGPCFPLETSILGYSTKVLGAKHSSRCFPPCQLDTPVLGYSKKVLGSKYFIPNQPMPSQDRYHKAPSQASANLADHAQHP